jgi:hypothetical protein
MSIGLRFKISMLVNETDLLRKVQSFLGFGTLGINKDGTVDFMVKDGTVDSMVKDLSNLLKIKEHFINTL